VCPAPDWNLTEDWWFAGAGTGAETLARAMTIIETESSTALTHRPDLDFGETALLHLNLLVHPVEKIRLLHPPNQAEDYPIGGASRHRTATWMQDMQSFV